LKFHEIFPDFYRDNEPWYEFIKEVLAPEFDIALEEVKALWSLIDIDTVPKEKLPLLADNLGFDFVEILPASYRKQLANAIDLHKFKGTRFAVEKVLKSLGIEGKLQEWFEYNGEAYRFKIDLFFENLLKAGITLSPEIQEKLLQLINSYKNERSWLEEIKFSVSFENTQKVASNGNLSSFTTTLFEEDDQKKITESFNDWVHYALVYQKSHVIVMVSRLTELGFCKKSNTKPTIFTFLADDWADVDRHSARFKEIESLV